MKPRFFLVAPESLSNTLLQCAEAACGAGDCASILVPEDIDSNTVAALQNLGLAVILKDAEPRKVHHLKADGLQVSTGAEDLNALRQSMKNESLGIVAGVSRHAAMEAAEAGVDYVAFTQLKQTVGEPIIGWWQEVTAVPAVAFDPVAPEHLSTLLPQNPDFIRPTDAMWESVEAARREITKLQAAMS